jgi:hypothetical protein
MEKKGAGGIMIRALLTAAAVIALFFTALLLFLVIFLAGFAICCIFGPSFDEYGHINECIGCPHAGDDCRGCRHNPEYWDRTEYIGPSRRELKRLRKEERT